MRIVEPYGLFNPVEFVTAQSAITKVKSSVSPYFGVQDLAFSYATV